MLFNPEWKQGTKAEAPAKVAPPSLVGLIAWLETQLPETEYSWLGAQHCLVAQYLRATQGWDCPAVYIGFDSVFGSDGQEGFRYHQVGNGGPTNFGAALERARKLL